MQGDVLRSTVPTHFSDFLRQLSYGLKLDLAVIAVFVVVLSGDEPEPLDDDDGDDLSYFVLFSVDASVDDLAFGLSWPI